MPGPISVVLHPALELQQVAEAVAGVEAEVQAVAAAAKPVETAPI